MRSKKASSSSFLNSVIVFAVLCLHVGPDSLADNPSSLSSAGRTVQYSIQACESAPLLTVHSRSPLAIIDQYKLIKTQRCLDFEKLVRTIRFIGYAAGVFAMYVLAVIIRHFLKGLFGQRICCR
jgi:hypothetical protein